MQSKILTGILIALLLASAVMNIKSCSDNKKKDATITELSKKVSPATAPIEQRYVDNNNISHAVIKEVPVKSAAEKSVAVGGGYLDTLTKALKISSDKIIELTQTNAQLEAKVRLMPISDPAQVLIKYYKDKWLEAIYNTVNDSLTLKYDVALNAAKYYKRKWFLSEKQHFIDFYSDDPRVTINGVKRFTEASTQKKRFGIGANLSMTYNPFKNIWRPAAGIGLNYNLIEF